MNATLTRTRQPRMTDEEKRTRREEKKAAAHAEKLASLVILGRATFKATGAVLFGVQSADKVYHLTMIAGKIRSCVDAHTGLSCKSRQYSGHCVHEERVMRYESQRQSELATAEQVAPLVLGEAFAGDLQAHAVDALASQDTESLARVNMTKFGISTPGYQPHETACDCGADGWQQHYRREAEVYKAEQARKELEKCSLSGNRGFSLLKPSGADAVVARVMSAPVAKRQYEDW